MGRHLPLCLLLGCASLDRVPPSAIVTAPDTVVRGTARFDLEVADERPGLAELWVSVDGGPPEALPPDATHHIVDTGPLADGEHTLVIRAVDASLRGNEVERTVRFTTDNTPPRLALARRSLTARPGDTWPIVVRADEPLAALTVHFGDDEHTPWPIDDRTWRVLRGLEFEAPTGPATLTVRAADALGNEVEVEVEVTVAPRTFAQGGYIRLSSSQRQARKDQAAIERMQTERGEAYTHEEAAQLWEGPFLRPTDGPLTSPFGKYRTYSDGKRSYHSGADLGGPTGTPVHAAAAGVVVLAHQQAIFGNVVIVHHGQGVSTSYNHLSAIAVAEGQRVARGDLLGQVGSTGQSTGPHLHWGLIVGGLVAADPMAWLEDDFSTFDDFVPIGQPAPE